VFIFFCFWLFLSITITNDCITIQEVTTKKKKMASAKAGRIAVSVAKGDGIGPEIMDATLHIRIPLHSKS
jgi:hypothetical protein